MHSYYTYFLQGGGKDLASAAAIMENRGNVKPKIEVDVKPDMTKMAQVPMGSYNPKIPTNMHPSTYDMMRNPASK